MSDNQQSENPGNNLQLRGLILTSMSIQIVLLATGSRRKYISKRWLGSIIWLFYLSADYVATLALGILSRSQGGSASSRHDPSHVILAFWAPFLLIHLGGPDTVTAYALEDNELWLRHAFQLIGQTVLALYVLVRSWTSAPLSYASIAIFVAGLIKYGERTWVLFLASKDQYRDSLLPNPDPGPDYTKFMEEYVSREREGYIVSVKEVIVMNRASTSIQQPDAEASIQGPWEINNSIIPYCRILREADYFFETFKQLFGDLILSFQDREISLYFFRAQTWDDAFGIVEAELGLVYDLLYTKAFIVYTPLGFLLRSLSFLFTLSALIGFQLIRKVSYPGPEVSITHILLYVAIGLEFYAFLILIASDRTMIWLTKDWSVSLLRNLQEPSVWIVSRLVPLLRYFHIVPSKMRWSNEIGQHNVFNCCLEGKPKCEKISKLVEKFLFRSTMSIPNGLKTLIFEELRGRATLEGEPNKRLGSYRGDRILLTEMNCFDKSNEIEFSQSLLLWHIATDLCYHTDVIDGNNRWIYGFVVDRQACGQDELWFKREASRLVSNYMIYLLTKSPTMLPSGIGQIRFQDTCAEVLEFLETHEKKIGTEEACQNLLKVDTRKPPSEVKGDRSKSLLFDACRLAKSLQSLELGQRWEKIFQAWLHILTFAAAQCRWNEHAEKLSQGGELITHVWLLMAHFGMTDHFQIAHGYVRAKLETR